MNDQEREAIATIALLSALADGNKADAERDEIRRVAETLDEGQAGDARVPMARIYRDVLLGRIAIDEVAARLGSAETRQLAYELAVGVVDADGLRNDAETAFLSRLSGTLGLDAGSAGATLAQADALATAPLGGLPATIAGSSGSTGSTGSAPSTSSTSSNAPAPTAQADQPGQPARVTPSDAEIDKLILNASILNGALELLPQSMASMAIIPLQMRMVYSIGASHGYSLDRGAIKELLATLGVGVTGQYLEDVGRKLLGGLLGKVGGKAFKGIGRAATGVAFSFATTWAIGQVARRYYAGGRTMSSESLRTSFDSLVVEARGLQTRYAPQIEDQSRRIDLGKLLQQVRGG